MGFLDRALRLVRADAHGVMDQLEERSLLLKQHLREAEVELTRKRVRMEALEEEERQLAQETVRLERQLGKLDEDVELALAGDKDELARFAVKRLLPVRDSLRSSRERAESLREERERSSDQLAVQQDQFEQLRTEVAARIASAQRRKAHEAGGAGASAAFAGTTFAADRGCATDEEVEIELLRRRSLAADSAMRESSQ